MFIPKGKAIHENLATSYVLVEPLVADLCEGGFTGVVEVALRDTDSHIIIARGNVAATIEVRLNGESETGGASVLQMPSVGEVAARAKTERGRVSVYSYSLATAGAIVGRITSQPLYTKLSTEFADLERMLSKLGREPDRQWFIEIESASGLTALIHLNDDRCWIMTSDAERNETEADTADLMRNAALRSVVDEFNGAGGTFDVFFKSQEEPASVSEADQSEQQWIEPSDLTSAPPSLDAPVASNEERADSEPADEVAQAVTAAKAAFHSLSPDDEALSFDQEGKAPASPPEPSPPSPAELEAARLAVFGPALESSVEEPTAEASKENAAEETRDDFMQSSPADATATDEHGSEPEEDELFLVRDDFKLSVEAQRASEAEVMAEVKRLMAEIARTIEEAVHSVEHRSTFPIHLRAGQLKVADRYPFLDPFGPEFEYLAGEIVFVGQVGPAEFVEGLTEALKHAVEGVAETSSQASRVRSRVSHALQGLLKQQQTEFEAYGLDESIEKIIAA